jgi:phosphoglycolate phosphatase
VLLLFDIDGTLLIDAAKAHGQALREAIGTVYGVHDAPKVETAGRTDPEIARHMLLEAGLSATRIDDGLRDLRVAAVEAYARLCPPDLSDRVAPGMAELVARLASREDALLALLTGNLEPVARLKVGRAGLGGFFARGQGAFGSDHEDRTELPAIARSRAGRGDRPHPREDTVVIGDTPRDIACARADGVRCLAVATGAYPPEALTGADAVALDVAALGSLLDALLAQRPHQPARC